MATIEPRLIHLLNESTNSPKPYNAELPPIQALSHPQSSSRPYPIEPGAGQRPDTVDANGGPSASHYIPSLHSIPDDGLVPPTSRADVPSYLAAERPFLALIPPQDLLGLLEPPSNAALFPPISSASFESRPSSEPAQALSLTKPPEAQSIPEETAIPSPSADPERTPTGKVKRRAAKPRRKWSEEETKHLLLGVNKHGVGRWTDILDDPGYKFNERSAGDLKDRFRTCCPEELRGSTGAKSGGPELLPTSAPRKERKPKKGLMSENILNDMDEEIYAENSWPGQSDSVLAPKQRKSRAHRKKLEDLVELGIKGPFKKSQRRERRPFSDQDDREILEGFELYGPHWTKIQRDPRFNLSSRQPTDLRDRLRNKYPEKFISTEKTTMQVRNSVLEPSVNMDIENSLNLSKPSRLEPQLNRTDSREDIPKWPLLNGPTETNEQLQSHASLYWGEGGGGGFPSGDMDISRLLLDDTQIMGEPPSADRRGYG
ncbi:hypothetical protein NUW58_g7473 [Xylaria curta]|uniref:Uncharacterized protein n=1 Tax=Xylaria curta TaxID=42375 RepID=A0ACC1NI09_9PEZI|nr:hypothetical protein NUW58_g7473 [Xylaria curta]